MDRLFVPPDNADIRDRYERLGRGGTCGVATVAALERKTVQSVIDSWAGEKGWPGYSPIREMRATLEKDGYRVKVCQGHKAKEFPFIDCMAAIVRVQWLDDDGKDYSGFMERARHTHYVLLEWHAGKILVFCNSDGWFPAKGKVARDYLKPGYVSSYLEVSRK